MQLGQHRQHAEQNGITYEWRKRSRVTTHAHTREKKENEQMRGDEGWWEALCACFRFSFGRRQQWGGSLAAVQKARPGRVPPRCSTLLTLSSCIPGCRSRLKNVMARVERERARSAEREQRVRRATGAVTQSTARTRRWRGRTSRHVCCSRCRSLAQCESLEVQCVRRSVDSPLPCGHRGKKKERQCRSGRSATRRDKQATRTIRGARRWSCDVATKAHSKAAGDGKKRCERVGCERSEVEGRVREVRRRATGGKWGGGHPSAKAEKGKLSRDVALRPRAGRHPRGKCAASQKKREKAAHC